MAPCVAAVIGGVPVLIHACPDASLKNSGTRCVASAGQFSNRVSHIEICICVRILRSSGGSDIRIFRRTPTLGVDPRAEGATIPYAEPCIGDTFGDLLDES